MKILVTGANGQLGADVVAEAERRNHETIGVDIDALDITDSRAVEEFIVRENPAAVVHCAAWTAVDAAEDSPAQVMAVNAEATGRIARICGKIGCKLLYISTDYVFDGQGESPWTPDSPCNPISVYGRSKREGEIAAAKYAEKLFVVRIAWVFGRNGNNFVKTMLRLADERDSLSVVGDQIGTPTYTADLARLLIDMAESDKYGIYHATNAEETPGGYISWYDFAAEIFAVAGKAVKLNRVTSAEFPAKAKRPNNSRLDKSKLAESGFAPLPGWRDALSRYLSSAGAFSGGIF